MKRGWVVWGTAVFVVALYVGLSAWGSESGLLWRGPGFPLDDGWIHQTYARNLAHNGRWEYTPGVVSAGSTSPLWTLLLTVGYLLRLPFWLWAFGLGAMCLGGLGWWGMRLWGQLWPAYASWDWLAGMSLVLTWPLIWAAASGMETLLFAVLGWQILHLYGQLISDSHSAPPTLGRLVWLGLLSGLLVLTRPEGVVLLGLVGVGLLVGKRPFRRQLWAVGVWAGASLLPLLPYFWFNWQISGTVWPNTLYAKQVEYAAELARPFWGRLVQLLYVSLGGAETGWRGMNGAHLLLLPGLLPAVWLAAQADWGQKRLAHLLPLLWAAGHVGLYAWRLPVTYQHGRYLLTAVPIWVIYGLAGWVWLGQRGRKHSRARRLARQVAGWTFAGLMGVFLFLGANAYANDVAFIEGEMVATARWLASNTPADALIAAHDIGAIGYLAQRPLLDLAGLVSPEIIPLLADEAALADYLWQSEATYLVTAPGWPYESVVDSGPAVLLFSTEYAWTKAQGQNNMAVYRLERPSSWVRR